MITALVEVGLTGVSVIEPVPLALTPLSVPITEDVHVYVVPDTEAVGLKFNGVALQIS